MSESEVTQAEKDGAALYNRAALALYDTLVLRVSNSLAWGCPTERLLAHYNANLGARHLDVGPGTGWYLKQATYPTASPEVALMDLNPATMKLTTSRLAGRGIVPTSHTGSILAPIDTGLGQFDSVAANFVMHCVPGTWAEKGAAFTHIAAILEDDGVFFGSTILGTGVPHNPLGKALCALYNGPMKVFHNKGDDQVGLETALEAAFETVDLSVVGTVAVFAARGPRRP
ncbi:class I SAM-dependent methyltransferase [Prescottella equi]|uniref:class I SAM-dependent methyltransferase n=1 Tax=Rhodococcus hoagii TaxID=43767 RepID=UPI00384F0ED9